ncbi:hypothetical protein KFE96_06560 [Kordiimonas sp. SCSIO 12603]|uniref:hypothetical protein n=1 Tax=Kordiimonas sp. SCSIO 12603 TaxID=2829596 RepID=UPI00210270B9|nr:hypothetical protein [Kordiimonas sp. SCSIO 12603]UTW59962.1 hypothetical protein KFE96_06560 [Kordiimonas sp. SCSIO 12603]
MKHSRKIYKTATSTQERSLRETCLAVKAEEQVGDARYSKESIAIKLEARLITAAWTLRRMPDREQSFLKMRGALWPEMMAEPGQYPRERISSFEARRRVRISAKEIDEMQPTLDLLLLLPDLIDRQILFWAAWHQDGEKQDRLPWAKVRRALLAANGKNYSRWTLKRRYEAGLLWLSALVLLQN